jgi:hypothetical protein
MQAARDAGNAVGDFSMIAPALAADDAEEELGRFAHLFFLYWRGTGSVVITGLDPLIHVFLAESEDVDGRDIG